MGGPGGIGSGVWQADLGEPERARLEEILERLGGDPFLRRVALRSVELMALAPGSRVLDVGCGTGVLLPALAEAVGRSGSVAGLDYSADLLRTARERVETEGIADVVTIIEGDATKLPFDDASFDSAHTDRVLMHLDDADAAIREMRRVVRPGGWVVAAEPDSLGVRIDHPADPETMALIADRDLRSFRNPNMGLELNRRFAQAGLVDRRIEPMIDFDPSYDPIAAAGDRRAAEALVAEGRISAERAEAAIRYLEEAAARGEYAWLGTMVVAAGRVPAA
jgi:SAM-dependent methyltransferase